MQMVRCASLIAMMAIPMLAGPVQYQINFTPDPTSATGLSVTGEFTYDDATDAFSSFTVQVDSLTFDLLGPLGVYSASCTGSDSSLAFALMTQTLSAGCNAPPGYKWNFFGDAGALIFEFVAGNITSNLPFSLGLSANVILDTGCIAGFPGCPDVFPDQEFGSYSVSTVSPIPEPGSLTLLLISSVALVGTRRLRGLVRKVAQNAEVKAIS